MNPFLLQVHRGVDSGDDERHRDDSRGILDGRDVKFGCMLIMLVMLFFLCIVSKLGDPIRRIGRPKTLVFVQAYTKQAAVINGYDVMDLFSLQSLFPRQMLRICFANDVSDAAGIVPGE